MEHQLQQRKAYGKKFGSWKLVKFETKNNFLTNAQTGRKFPEEKVVLKYNPKAASPLNIQHLVKKAGKFFLKLILLEYRFRALR